MLLREMKQKHNEHLKAIKVLDAKEELSEKESKELETRMTECEALTKKIERRNKLELLESKTIEDQIPQSEKRSYSLAGAIKLLINGKRQGSYEAECHQELEKRQKTGEGGVLVPSKELWGDPGQPEKRLVDNQSSLVSDPLRPEFYLPALYEQSIVGALGIRRVSATGSFNFPKSSATTAGWISGDGAGADSTLSTQDQTFTSQSVTPKFLGAITGWSLRQLKQMAGNLSLEGILRENLVMAMSEKLDDSIINSDDSTTAYNPKGLKTLLGATTNNKALDFSGGVAWTWEILTELKQELRTQYKNRMISPKFLIDPGVEKEWSDKQRFASSDGQSLLDSIKDSVVVSSHLDNKKVFFGQWSDLVLCTFDSVELSLGLLGQDFALGNQRLRAIGCFDFWLNRTEAFRQITVTRA